MNVLVNTFLKYFDGWKTNPDLIQSQDEILEHEKRYNLSFSHQKYQRSKLICIKVENMNKNVLWSVIENMTQQIFPGKI